MPPAVAAGSKSEGPLRSRSNADYGGRIREKGETMFDITGRRQIVEAIEMLSTNLAVTQGQVAGLHAVVTSIIATMKESERQTIVELSKQAVGQGFGGNRTWLNGREKQAYDDAMGVTVQSFLKKSLPKARVLKARKRASSGRTRRQGRGGATG